MAYLSEIPLALALLARSAGPAFADHWIVVDDSHSVGITLTGAWTTASSDSERFGEGFTGTTRTPERGRSP